MRKRARIDWPKAEQTLRRLGLLIFTTLELKKVLGIRSIRSVYSILYRYKKRGLIVQISKGLYAIADTDLPDLYVANILYRPSYVSFETALSYHNIIPETVYAVSSATTRTTRRWRIKTLNRLFIYHKIKRQAYTGYSSVEISGRVALMADAEKAMVDLLYLVARGIKKLPGRIYAHRLNKDKMIFYAKSFGSSKLLQLVREL